MIQFQRVGYKADILLKKSFILSKILTKNSFLVPNCKRIRIIFPLYEAESILRSKSIIILLEFLEQMSGLRSIIKKANLIVGYGLWVRGQIDISGIIYKDLQLFLMNIFFHILY